QHMADIDAEYAFVRVHETNRIELKPWRVGEHGKDGQEIAFLAARERRNAKHPESAGRGKHAVPLFPGLATDRVEDQLNTATSGDVARPCLEILGTIVDEMVDAQRAHVVMLAGRCRADHTRPDVFRNLRRGNTNPASY